ncbi:hypothetical protein K493DRAFT_339889 [Basidiobolus meristosporus CBS 931.73]|uniref:chitin synthase n=1 Tax=Basidiobolus meristosporus CBS 931.73 TaxID=1314790 RepID=A0A1Y1XXZ2_9FUNG|nr:hypothetical protein K493DRAFT_339889 [Basidiobolus meristosporus CBS 931.73]|eukprot:ORX90618.1 hypothetical protein K493DRAFT_339889 [Basidiobolus meristosporus CBS 931.73]
MSPSNKKYSKPSFYRHIRGNGEATESGPKYASSTTTYSDPFSDSQQGTDYSSQTDTSYNPWDTSKKDLFFEPSANEKCYFSQPEAGSLRKNSKNSIELSRELSHGKKFPKASKARRYWLLVSKIFTIFIPDFLLKSCGKKDPDSRQSLREKITLFLILSLLSLLFIVWVELIPLTFCTPYYLFTPGDLAGTSYVAINGKVVDFSHSTTVVAEEVGRYSGKDVSLMFPSFTLLARTKGATEYPDQDIQRCIQNLTRADNWLEKRIFNDPGYLVTNQKLIECPSPNDRNKSSAHCFYNASVRHEVAKATVGDLVFDYSILGRNEPNLPQLAYMIANGHLYDMSDFIKYSSAPASPIRPWSPKGLDPESLLFPREVTELIFEYVGEDATGPFSRLEHGDTYLRCMDKLFYKGAVKETVLPQCRSFNPILWITFGLPFMFLTICTVASLLVFPDRSKIQPSSNCIVMVPCYCEDQQTLKSNFDSVARSDCHDSHKLLMVICDGIFTAPGNVMSTHQIVLDILGFSGPEPELKAYISLGEGNKNINLAKVYSGFYECGTHRIGYVVVVKYGNPMEIRNSGNRGKRDSILVMWNFLEGLLDPENKLTPLEYELFHHINNVIGIDPRSFQYALVLDADTSIAGDALSRLIARMERDQRLMAVSGYAKPLNPTDSFVTMLQAYPFFMSHYIKPVFESMIGGVTFLHGPCTMYRIKYSDSKPCVVDTTTIIGFSTPRPNTMHMRNTLLLGEDSFFSVILLKTFPHLRFGFESSAICYTRLTPRFAVFLGQQGRITSAAFHSYFELARVYGKTSLGLIYQLVTMIKLLSSTFMPVFVLYLYYVIIRSIATDETAYLIVGTSLICMFGFNAMILAVRGQFAGVFWLVFSVLFSLPFYCLLIPLYSLWHSDNCLWVDTVQTNSKSIRRKHGILDDTNSQYKVSMQISLLTIAEYDELENDDESLYEDIRYEKPQRLISLGDTSPAPSVELQSDRPEDMVHLAKHVDQRAEEILISIPQVVQPIQIKTKKDHHLSSGSNKNLDSDVPLSLSCSPKSPGRLSQATANSTLQSEYSTDYTRSSRTFSYYSHQLDAATNDMESQPRSRPESDRSSSRDHSHLLNGTTAGSKGALVQRLMREEIYYFLKEANLNTVTRRDVKERLFEHFGDAVTIYNDFIHDCIEEFTLERLALLPSATSPQSPSTP